MKLDVLILAAGQGKRMRSSLPKVLHKVGGLPMLGHVLRSCADLRPEHIGVIVGPDSEHIEQFLATQAAAPRLFVQQERLGTGHAVMAAQDMITVSDGPVLIVYGDTPLIRTEVLAQMVERIETGSDVCVLGFDTPAPTGYGRLLMDGTHLTAIREEKDASEAERQVTLCNAGAMVFGAGVLPQLLAKLSNDNAQGEYYLTDCVELARAANLSVQAVIGAAQDAAGVNSRAQLADVETLFQNQRRTDALEAGVTLVAPETVYFSYDTDIAPDVTIEPHVVFGPGVTVASGVEIKGFSHIEGANIAANCVVGPYARLRPGTQLAENTKIGNFVEVKSAEIGAGSKINHLTYVGDAQIGRGVNVGAGSVTCNYDGFSKHKTIIGDGSFVGSGSLLVAPISVGENAYIATGSTLTSDVPDQALAFGRARQENKPGKGAALKDRLKRAKEGR